MYRFILSVLLAGLPFSGLLAQDNLAKVVTLGAPAVDCVADVEINKIDGKKEIVPARGFNIEPGEHSLNGRALIDTTWCKLGKDDRIFGPVADLKINVQAGRTYYIGFDHKPDNRQGWKLVVWKVE